VARRARPGLAASRLDVGGERWLRGPDSEDADEDGGTREDAKQS
jgi:hypothetical protein